MGLTISNIKFQLDLLDDIQFNNDFLMIVNLPLTCLFGNRRSVSQKILMKSLTNQAIQEEITRFENICMFSSRFRILIPVEAFNSIPNSKKIRIRVNYTITTNQGKNISHTEEIDFYMNEKNYFSAVVNLKLLFGQL